MHYRGRTFHSVPTERVFNQIPWVKRCALVSLGAGHTPGIVVEPEASTWSALAERRIDLLRELRLTAESHELTRPITAFFFHPSLPVDKRHSAKIFREHLSLWAQRQVRSEAA